MKKWLINTSSLRAQRSNPAFKMLAMIIACVFLSACSNEPKLKDSHFETVELRSIDNTLFYTGTIQPLKTIVIPSPADGAIVDMSFQYGEHVKAGQLLYVLSSAKFLSDYKSALMQYLKAKNDFDNSQTQLKEGEFLHKNELISDDDFKNRKSNYYASQLSLTQAKDALEVLIQQLAIKNMDLYKLSIADVDKINEAMHLQANSENLRVISPAAGTILSTTKNDEEVKKLIKGDTVKQGDVLAIIGDLSGLSVRIKVNELTVNQLKVGQKVKVTGIAFPDDVLNGEIKQVDRQGENSNGGLPTFPVEIIVPTLSAKQQEIIHVGMSAKIEINSDEEPKISIPIAAVEEKNGETYVSLYDEKSHQLKKVIIKTGSTTMDSVSVLSGLKPGDKIVVPN